MICWLPFGFARWGAELSPCLGCFDRGSRWIVGSGLRRVRGAGGGGWVRWLAARLRSIFSLAFLFAFAIASGGFRSSFASCHVSR
jgi:hypothetical protein